MLRMEYEKEVVLNIRHRIEIYEQEQQFNNNATDVPDPMDITLEHSHIHLGSRQRSLKLRSYEIDLEEMIGFCGFGDSLAGFLRDYTTVEVYGSDFDGDRFRGQQH